MLTPRFLPGIALAVLLILAGCRQAETAPPTVPTESVSSKAVATPHIVAASDVEAGRYLVIVGGCNDCHTAGYLQTEGNVPESEWLLGSPVGWRGPWGTTYPSNLRLTTQNLTEDGFVTILKTRKALPPMPWMNVARLSDRDARAIYRYIRSLGPKGEVMPAAVPPGVEPSTPYLDLEPKHMERLAAAMPAPAAEAPEAE